MGNIHWYCRNHHKNVHEVERKKKGETVLKCETCGVNQLFEWEEGDPTMVIYEIKIGEQSLRY